MKQKIKKLKLLLSLFLAGFLVTSCQLEEDLIKSNNLEQNKYKIVKKNFNELMKETQFKTAFSKIPKQKTKSTLLGKTVMEHNYGFNITDSPATVMSVGTQVTSYTFHITRETLLPTNQFENLIVQVDSTGSTNAYIIKYHLNEAPIYNATDKEYSYNIHHTDLTPIVYNNAEHIQSKVYYTGADGCTIITLMCDYGVDHPAGEACLANATNRNFYLSSDSSACNPGAAGSTGGVSSSSSSTSSTSSGGSSGGTVNGIYTGPSAPSDNDPCTKVKPKGIRDLQSELADLATKTTDTVERGLYKLSNESVIRTLPSGANGEIEIPYPTGTSQYTIIAHTHNSPANKTYSVFSWTDLETIAKLIRDGKIDTPNFVAYLATADGTYYAMTIENPTVFAQFFALYGETDFDPVISMKKYGVKNKYYNENNLPNVVPIIKEDNIDNLADEKAFLSFLQDNNLGATLFETNNTFTNFEKVTINKMTNNIDKQPCSN